MLLSLIIISHEPKAHFYLSQVDFMHVQSANHIRDNNV